MTTRVNKERLRAICPGHDDDATAMTEAICALWSMRVLDSWARKHGHTTPAPLLWEAGSETRNPTYRIWIPAYELTSDLGFIRRPFQGRSEDEARFAAARNLVTEDSTLNPIPGLPFE